MADKAEDKVVIKKIQDILGSTPQSVTSVLRAWKEGRIGSKNAMMYLASRVGKKIKTEKKGGAINKYAHGGSVSSGHDLTYKRK